jgi:hypothetical protein
MYKSACTVMLLTAIALFLSVDSAFAVGDRWGCRKFPDHNIYFYNGGTGDDYDVTQEVTFTDSGAWNPATSINLIQVGGFSYGNTDQGNVEVL